VPVGKEPFQLALSASFAHVRCLGSEKVFMVNLLELGKETPPPVNSYPVGRSRPGDSGRRPRPGNHERCRGIGNDRREPGEPDVLFLHGRG